MPVGPHKMSTNGQQHLQPPLLSRRIGNVCADPFPYNNDVLGLMLDF